MKLRRSEQLHYIAIYITAAVALILGVISYSGLALEQWLITVTLALILIYLQTIVVRIGERTDYSLATAAVFPIIFLAGNTPAMLVAVLAGLADGIVHKKEWRRTLFNVAQLSISALVGSLAFEYISAKLGSSGFGMGFAMLVGTITYIFTNLSLVSLLVAMLREVPWLTQLREIIIRSFYSSFSSAYIGVIFTFFVMSYGFWGVVGFGTLLIMLSELLKGAVEVSSERARRRELEEELIIDEMTGALNFRFLNNWLNDTSDQPVSVLFVDIDDFALFNNHYGHAEGDKVLKRFVDTINQSVRSDDKVIRYGGDEFVVLLKGMGGDEAMVVARRIMDNLRSLTDTKWDEPITVSIGIASHPEDTTDKHQLLLFADQAMYAAKDDGKDTLCFWDHIAATARAATSSDPC